MGLPNMLDHQKQL